MRLLGLESVRPVPTTLSALLTWRGGGDGGAFAIHGVYEIFELFAWFEEGNLLRRHFHFLPGLGVATDSAAPLTSAEAAKSAYLDFVALLQGTDNALENG